MIPAECASCSDELTEPGGLLFSPPIVTGGPNATVNKLHLCKYCFAATLDFIRQRSAVVDARDERTWRHADGSVRVDHMDARAGDYYG